MNLKYFIRSIICFALVIAVAACNSSDNDYTIEGSSSDGQIKTFKVLAEISAAKTATDTILFTALKATAFTVQNKGGHEIFNVDSLPQNSDIRSLKLEIAFTSSPQSIKLIYKDKNMNDSLVDWNNADSVKFIKIGDSYYPRFSVVAPNELERRYTVDLRIHKLDPDSIRWTRATIANSTVATAPKFDLLKNGETKVFKYEDSEETFRAFTKSGSSVYTYTSKVSAAKWENEKTINALPIDFEVKSIYQTDKLYAGITKSGSVYTSGLSDGVTWTKRGLTNIKAILGLLPEVNSASPKNEFFVIYTDSKGELRYGKTANFDTIEEVAIKSQTTDEVLSNFPIKYFSATTQETAGSAALILTGGVDKGVVDKDGNLIKEGALIRRTWRVSNISLASGNEKATISLIPGNTAHIFPTKDGVSAFEYNDKTYALSADSLKMYQSTTGDIWTKTDVKQNLDKAMANARMASVVVDKQNYIWVFGGVSTSGSYSQQIWRGRLNRLAPKE